MRVYKLFQVIDSNSAQCLYKIIMHLLHFLFRIDLRNNSQNNIICSLSKSNVQHNKWGVSHMSQVSIIYQRLFPFKFALIK